MSDDPAEQQPGGVAPATRTRRSLSRRMLLLALATVLPMLALAVTLVYQAASTAQAHADAMVLARVSRLARDAAAAIERAGNVLEFLSARPEVRNTDVPACQRLLSGLNDIDGIWANLAILAPDGRLLCAARMPEDGRAVSMGDRDWFRRVVAQGGLVIGPPVRAGPVLGRPVLPVARALRNEQGQVTGVALLPLDLLSLSERLGDNGMPSGSSFVVQAESGHIVARFPDPARWVGVDASEKLARFKRLHPKGLGLEEGLDGVRRVYAVTRLDPLGWTAVVGVPQAQVLAAAREAWRDALLGLLASIALGGVVAVVLARRISHPLEALARTAEAVANGQVDARAPEAAGGELQTVARQFNRMLDRQATVEQGLRRASSLYETLARANRAMVRGGSFADIAGEVCRACVESGNATLVAVAMHDGRYARILVGAGPIASVYTGQFERLDCAAPELAHLPMPTVLRTGEPVICNDYLSLQLVSWVRDRAVELDLRAMAVFPLRCAGRVWGGLIFHTAVVGWFDEERVQLLAALADDLSYVLDNQAKERARQMAEAALRERDHQMAGIVETAMDAVITIDAAQRIRVFNAAASRIFRIEAAEAIGQSIERFIPPMARADHAHHVQAFARDGAAAAHRMGGLRSLCGLRADGAEFPIEASIARHGQGDEVLMTVIVRDVSDLKAAEQARGAQLAAEAANQAKSAFLANMSHEIRTPMNAILGFTDLALRTELTPQQAGYLSKSRVAAEGLLGLIDRILDLSKIEAGRLELERREFALDELVHAVQVVVAEPAGAKGLGLHISVAPTLPRRMVGDVQRLKQVLINLAGNAVKFTESGEVMVALEGEPLAAAGVRLKCTVRDTGIGMTPDQVERVFEPFTQADASTARRYGGTGLGLAISRQLVELMGGHIDVRSVPAAGSEFSFEIELGGTAETAPDVRPGTATGSVNAGTQGLRGRKVLLVEDNEFNQLVAGEVLRELAGMQVTLASSGAEALQALDREVHDVVLMDVQMPGMDGYETARRIRAVSRHAALPIIAMTAHASASDRQSCLAAGMNDFVSKPFVSADLLAMLARWVQAAERPTGDASP